jgi:putative nucleotidyltransferase with HDIG domain
LNDRLLAAPATRAARESVDGDEAWLVGGAIRDAALGLEVVDADLVVVEGEREAARAIARAVDGDSFQLSAEFGTWRALAADRSWHVDVSRLRGDAIEDDLRLRDFTVNAVALPLAALDSEPIDPTGGLADVDDRLLRAVSPRSFSDDPLRVLRLARLGSMRGLKLERGTIELARAAAPFAGETAGERQFAELRMIVAGADPIRGIGLIDEVGATGSVLPEIEALRGVEQNPNHHLDVYDHTLEVLAQLLGIERDVARLAGERAVEADAFLDEPLADELSRRAALRLGALVHDVGKPATREQRGGYVTFVGHDNEGARIVARMAERLRVSSDLRAYLMGLTRHHLRLGFLVAERPLTRRRVHDYLRATEPVSADVTLLSAADRLAARGEGPLASAEMVEGHIELARELLAAALDWHREGPPAAPIRGDDLAQELGIEPGPEIGRLLGEIEAAVYAGEVSGRDEAVELARGLVDR